LKTKGSAMRGVSSRMLFNFFFLSYLNKNFLKKKKLKY
jgi:hypothetical protein